MAQACPSPAKPGVDFGCSFLKLDQDLHLADWFTPFNFASLNRGDNDVGSSGPVLVPNTPWLIGGGKEGKLYVLDTTGPHTMGEFHPTTDQVVQSFQATGLPRPRPGGLLEAPPQGTHHIHGSPVYWQGPKGAWVYIWPENDWLRAYHLKGNKFDTHPISLSSVTDPRGMPGGILSLSADGSKAGTGIVWATHSDVAEDADHGATQHIAPGILRAFDASDLSRELWNSNLDKPRDDLGNFAKFSPPIVANGKVFVATFSGHLNVYGLLNAP